MRCPHLVQGGHRPQHYEIRYKGMLVFKTNSASNKDYVENFAKGNWRDELLKLYKNIIN